MSTAEPTVPTAPYPLHALTTSELSAYRGELEHAVEGLSDDAPAAGTLRRLLVDVLDEEDQRRKIRRSR